MDKALSFFGVADDAFVVSDGAYAPSAAYAGVSTALDLTQTQIVNIDTPQALACGCALCAGGRVQDPGDGSGPLAWQAGGFDRGGPASNGKTSFTIDEAAVQLTRAGRSWSGSLGQAATVTFAFRADIDPLSMPTDTQGFSRFTDVQIAATLLALQSWSDVANLTFVRVGTGAGDAGYSNNATILFGNYSSGQDGAAAFAYYPGGSAVSGDVWVNSTLSYNAKPVMNDPNLSYGNQVLVHEIGHAIGLGHPGDYNADPDKPVTYGNNAAYFEDSRQYSLMSYFGSSNTGGTLPRYAAAPQLDDIAAAQRLYGANTTTRVGDTVYGFNSNADRPWFMTGAGASAPVFAVWDAGGYDTFDFSGYTMNQLIDLRAGAFSNIGGYVGNVAIAKGVTIEAAIGGSGNDVIRGNDANNTLNGGAGNDILIGSGGSDVLIGGAGVDTAQYIGLFRGYGFQGVVGQQTVIGGAEGGTDTLRDVELLVFADGTLSFDVDGASAKVYRMYDSALGRAPDSLGQRAWTTNFANGLTLKDLAQAFLDSPEYQARFGGLDDRGFVQQLYRLTLRREADAAGEQNWVNHLRNGVSRADMLMAFSESQEHRDFTKPALDQGFWVQNEVAASVARLYDSVLDRRPDAGGLLNWMDQVQKTSLLKVAEAFLNSAEFQAKVGNLSDDAFVDRLYQVVLDRASDPAGKANWVGQLQSGLSRAQLLLAFSESFEHQANTQSWIDRGIQFGGALRGDGDGPHVIPGLDLDAPLTLPPSDGGSSLVHDGPLVVPGFPHEDSGFVADDGDAMVSPLEFDGGLVLDVLNPHDQEAGLVWTRDWVKPEHVWLI